MAGRRPERIAAFSFRRTARRAAAAVALAAAAAFAALLLLAGGADARGQTPLGAHRSPAQHSQHPPGRDAQPLGGAHRLRTEPERATPASPHPVLREGLNPAAVAYVVLAHDMDSVKGTAELLEALYISPALTRFYVHIDLDAWEEAVKLLRQVLAQYPPEVAVMVPRIKVGWADVTMVDAELSALRAADAAWAGWSRAIILSGTAYPIKSKCQRQKWFRDTDPRVNLVNYEKLWKICEWGDPGTGEHCKKTRGRCMDRDCTRMTNTPNNGVVYKGPQWIMLSRPFSEYVLTAALPRLWLDFFRNFSEGPDEMYFPTVLMNGPEEYRRWTSVGTPRGTRWWDHLAPFIEDSKNGTAMVPNDAGNPKEAKRKHSEGPEHRVLRTPALMYTLWNSARRLGCPSYASDSPWGWSPCWLGRDDFPDLVRSDRQFARKMRSGEGVKFWLNQLWNRTCPAGKSMDEDLDPDSFVEGFRAHRSLRKELMLSQAEFGEYVYTGPTSTGQRMYTYSILLILALAQNVARMVRRLTRQTDNYA